MDFCQQKMVDRNTSSPHSPRRMWHTITPTEDPPHRSCHTANIYQNQMIIFGGISPKKQKLSDLHAFDLTLGEWRELRPRNITPNLTRYCHTCEIYKNLLIIFGGIGEDGSRHNDVKVLDLKTLEWIDPRVQGTPPVPRSHHGSVLFGSKLIIFGGLSGLSAQRLNDVHILDLTTWQWSQPIISGTPPTGRLFPTVGIWQSKMVVFGGYTGSTRLNDTHFLDLATMTWSEPLTRGNKPPVRYGQAGVVVGSKLIITGGTVNDRHPEADIHVLDMETMEWQLLQSSRLPKPRKHHTACLHDNKLYLYGGSTSVHGKLGDVDVLNLDAVSELGELAFDEVKTKLKGLLSQLKHQKHMDGKTEELINDSLRLLKMQYSRLRKERDAIQRETEKLERERENFELSKEKMAIYAETHKPEKIVKLNVGGMRFETTIATLRSDSQSMLASMFSGRYNVPTSEDGYVFIDRDGSHFRYILNYLRDGVVHLPPNDLVLCLDLLQEAQFYQLEGLTNQLKRFLKSFDQGQSSPVIKDVDDDDYYD